eukprot:Blabericola_migrator_1__6316@NODE_318_length_9886_cov_105_778796_g259_i0_p4_GENE_NODE_318_length_9886_cov_105_778796_g259_i0NODE_318_length_9886_cov_105_778796_g259_i0_p4_ORF_typecomplete_len324_score20_82_NODE_318_length_9886_cov_105_778796_g259_i0421013
MIQSYRYPVSVMPVSTHQSVSVFREVEQCMLQYPPFLLNLSCALFQLPGFNCHRKTRQMNNSLERVARVLASPTMWTTDVQHLSPDTFLCRFKKNLQERYPEWLSALPLRMSEYPTGVLVGARQQRDNGSTQLYCLLEPQQLELLLDTSRTSGVDSFSVRDGFVSPGDQRESTLVETAAIMVTRAVNQTAGDSDCYKEAPTSPVSSDSTPPLTRFSARSTPVRVKRDTNRSTEDLSTTGLPSQGNNTSSCGDDTLLTKASWTPGCGTPCLHDEIDSSKSLVEQRVPKEGSSLNLSGSGASAVTSRRVSSPSRLLWPAKSLGQV